MVPLPGKQSLGPEDVRTATPLATLLWCPVDGAQDG